MFSGYKLAVSLHAKNVSCIDFEGNTCHFLRTKVFQYYWCPLTMVFGSNCFWSQRCSVA